MPETDRWHSSNSLFGESEYQGVCLNGEVAVVRRCDSCRALSEKLQRCAGCEVATYCSKDCQRQHWRAGHKNSCKMFSKTPLTSEHITAMLSKAEESSSDEEESEHAGKQARPADKPARSSA